MAFSRDVDPRDQWNCLSDLRARQRPLSPHAAADPACASCIATVRDALRLHLAHDDLTRYNAVQRTLYVGIILVGILQVISGLVVWKPMQFSELTTLFYDFQGARLVHFLGMAAIVLFLRRARGACAARSEDTGCDGDGRTRARRPSAGRAAGPRLRPTSPDDRRAS